jgi:hypothetical protein
VKIAFKNQPLPFHQNARPAAAAALDRVRQVAAAGVEKSHQAEL